MSLIEQRASYMSRLQTLIDARQKDIDEKVAAYRAQLEVEHVQPYRAELEKEKVTPEMNQLVEFIGQIDAMLAYENTHAETSTEDVESDEVVTQTDEVDNTADASVEPKEAEVNAETFPESVQADTAKDINDEHATAQSAEELVGTGFEAIAADLADTKAKLWTAVEGRPGMPGIVLPRR